MAGLLAVRDMNINSWHGLISMDDSAYRPLFIENNPEGCSFVKLGFLHKYFTVMIVFNDPASKGKAKAPAPLFGSKARLKHRFEL